MLNKSTFSILMAVLFFVNSLRAMEDPNRDKNLEQGIQKQDSKENESSKTTACSLKDIIVRKLGLEVLSKIDPTAFPEELREYGIKFLINEHCATLEKFKENGHAYGITEKDLNNYKQVLCELCEKQIEGIDLALAEFGKCWHAEDGKCWPVIFSYMSLFDVVEFLKILAKQNNNLDTALSDYELICRDEVLNYILNTKNVELFKLLLNKGLLPRLDYKININNYNYNVNNYVCSFFKRLVRCKFSYFFETVMQKEKDKDYDWKQLFDQEEDYRMGDTPRIRNAMINAVRCFDQNIFKAILELAREKGLLDINAQDHCSGWTILISAVNDYNFELVKLLLENGADISIKSYNGKTALDHAKKCLDETNIQLERADLGNDNCVCWEGMKLSACEIITVLSEYGAAPDLVLDQ